MGLELQNLFDIDEAISLLSKPIVFNDTGVSPSVHRSGVKRGRVGNDEVCYTQSSDQERDGGMQVYVDSTPKRPPRKKSNNPVESSDKFKYIDCEEEPHSDQSMDIDTPSSIEEGKTDAQ
jgi:hypothetical protein